MTQLGKLITTCGELGSAKALEALGVSSGEVSQRRAREIYGSWVVKAFRDGRLRPSRIEDGRAGTIWFRVVDILSLRVEKMAAATIIDNSNTLAL